MHGETIKIRRTCLELLMLKRRDKIYLRKRQGKKREVFMKIEKAFSIQFYKL
jgi:hypothetical protein